jgi:hypothetical protein
MNSPYLIILKETDNKEVLEAFYEKIRSYYISKKAYNNVFIISVPEQPKATEIHKQISNKTKINTSFLVIRLDNFFGGLPDEVWEWFRETFPTIILFSDKEKTRKDEEKQI